MAASPTVPEAARPPASGTGTRAAPALALALAAVALWACGSDGATQVPDETRIQVALVVLAALGAAGWAAGARIAVRASPVAWVGLAGLAGFAAWSGLSLGWSITPDRSWAETNRALAYVLAVGLGVVVGSSDPRALRRLPVLVLAVAGLVALYAFATKALPGVHVGPLDLDRSGVAGRLREPLGYWNALGLVCAIGLPIGLRLASQASRRVRERAAALAVAFLLLCTLGLTYSRGGFVAYGVGLVVLTALGPARLRGLALAGALAVAAVPVLAAGYGLDGIAGDNPPLGQRIDDGRVLLVVLVVCLAALLVALRGLVWLEGRARWRPERTREVFRGLAILASFALLAGTVGLALSEKGLPRTVQDRVESFTEPGGDDALQPGRLVEASSGNRWVWWQEAGGAWSDRPVRGWGAGSFRALHLRYRQDEIPVTEAHSTPMQFLAETGLVGAVLGLGAVLALLAAAVGRVRALAPGGDRDVGVAALAGAAGWAVHGLYDWDWDFPAATFPALLLLGVLVARPGPGARADYAAELVAEERRAPVGRVLALAGLGLALAAVAVSAILPAWAGGQADEAQSRLGDQPTQAELSAAAAQAERAGRLDPVGLAPLRASAAIAKRRGRLLDARRFGQDEVERQPDSARAWEDLAGASLELADRAGFERAALRALALDPRSSRLRLTAQLALRGRVPPGLSATAAGTPLAPASPGATVAPTGTTGSTAAAGATG